MMDLRSEIAGRYIRIIALVTLLVGLADAARLLGVSAGSQSPLAVLGAGGFVYLATFSLARLFAAVGLWIHASWGAVLLIGATAAELGLFLFGSPHVELDAFGFALRLVLLVSIVLVIVLRFRWGRAQD